jgi:ATP-dependent RNA helicase HelY
VAVAYLGGEIRQLRTWSEVDYLAPKAGAVRLPPEIAEVTPLPSSPALNSVDKRVPAANGAGQVLPLEMRAELDRELAALDLPDLAEVIAKHRARLARDLAEPLALATARHREASAERADTEARIAAHPSHDCPDRSAHRESLQHLKETRERRIALQEHIDRSLRTRRSHTRQMLRSIVRVLEQFGYLRHGEVTATGRALAEVFDTNGLIICEALGAGLFRNLGAAELAEVLSWFAYDRDQAFPNHSTLPRRLLDLRDRLATIEAGVLKAESSAGIGLSTGFNRHFYGLALGWCRGASFESVASQVTLAEGDIMLTFSKTLDLMRQLREMLKKLSPNDELLARLAEAEGRMRRGIVEQCTRLTEPPTPEQGASGTED